MPMSFIMFKNVNRGLDNGRTIQHGYHVNREIIKRKEYIMHDQYPPHDGFYQKVVSLLETHQLF